MSQDDQNSQQPSSPVPQANQPETTAGKVTQPPHKQYQRVEPFWKTKTTEFLVRLQSWWSIALAKIRSLLPDSLSAKISDTVLTAVVGVIFVITVWIASGVFTHKSSEVVSIPPAIVATKTVTAEVVAPIEVQPTQEITPLEPQPAPVIPTPEQTLIVAIENQVAQESDRLGSGLVESVKANFRNSSLIIKVSDNWYNLQPSQQQELATSIQKRSAEFDFTHLDIIDTQGKLVARNPVVGTEMIILKSEDSI